MIDSSVFVVGPISTNCYFLYNEDKELVIIDPGDCAGRLSWYINDMGLTPRAILLTHAHFDHIGAVRGLKDRYPDIPIYINAKEKAILEFEAARIPTDGDFVAGEATFLSDGDHLSLIGEDIELIETPGHTAGSSCYYIAQEHVLYSGDTLFADGVGRTDLYTGSTLDIVHSIRDVLMNLPDDTAVYPGHGAETSIGAERKHNYIMQM